MKKIILFGAGGHSKVIQDIVSQLKDLELYAILDDSFKHTKEKNGVIYGNPMILNELNKGDFVFCIAIGNNIVRKDLVERFQISIGKFKTLIHPSAVISESAKVGYGTVVMPNAVINADTTIGNHCIINSGAIVEHDNVIGDYVHVSPNATLAGTVSIGVGTHVGSTATVIPNKQVGKWTTIGAGTVVVKDIPDKVTVVGVPGKVIKENKH